MLIEKKKLVILAAAAIITTLSLDYTTVLANTVFYHSNEGIGIETKKPSSFLQRTKNPLMYSENGHKIIDDDKVLVDDGELWATWDMSALMFRANYYHRFKIHRCTATNNLLVKFRSKWEHPGMTATSPWIEQTPINNKIWAKTM